MRHVDYENLPDDTLPRIKLLVENSSPDPAKPQLPPEVESELVESDRAQASCYAGIEEVTFRTQRLADQIKQRG